MNYLATRRRLLMRATSVYSDAAIYCSRSSHTDMQQKTAKRTKYLLCEIKNIILFVWSSHYEAAYYALHSVSSSVWSWVCNSKGKVIESSNLVENYLHLGPILETRGVDAK